MSEYLFSGEEWSYDTIQRIHDAVAEIAVGEFGLDIYPNQIEIITAEQMLDAYASTGMGTAQHLAGEILQRTAGVQILHVPYRGSGAVRADILAGRIQTMFDNVAVMLPYVQRGEMLALALALVRGTRAGCVDRGALHRDRHLVARRAVDERANAALFAADPRHAPVERVPPPARDHLGVERAHELRQLRFEGGHQPRP